MWVVHCASLRPGLYLRLSTFSWTCLLCPARGRTTSSGSAALKASPFSECYLILHILLEFSWLVFFCAGTSDKVFALWLFQDKHQVQLHSVAIPTSGKRLETTALCVYIKVLRKLGHSSRQDTDDKEDERSWGKYTVNKKRGWYEWREFLNLHNQTKWLDFLTCSFCFNSKLTNLCFSQNNSHDLSRSRELNVDNPTLPNYSLPLSPFFFCSPFPQYFKYVFPDGVDTVIVKVSSDMNFPCSVMSIQDIQVRSLPLLLPAPPSSCCCPQLAPVSVLNTCSTTLRPHQGVIESLWILGEK